MTWFKVKWMFHTEEQALNRNKDLKQRRLLRDPFRTGPCSQETQANFSICVQIRTETYCTSSSGEELNLGRLTRIVIGNVNIKGEYTSCVGRRTGQWSREQCTKILGRIFIEPKPCWALFVRWERRLERFKFSNETFQAFGRWRSWCSICISTWRIYNTSRCEQERHMERTSMHRYEYCTNLCRIWTNREYQ